MPYALRHAATGELLSAYRIQQDKERKYVLLLWDVEPEAEARLSALARASAIPLPESGGKKSDRLRSEWEQEQELSRWKPCLLGDHQAKLANVILKGDPARRICLREGELLAEQKPV